MARSVSARPYFNQPSGAPSRMTPAAETCKKEARVEGINEFDGADHLSLPTHPDVVDPPGRRVGSKSPNGKRIANVNTRYVLVNLAIRCTYFKLSHSVLRWVDPIDSRGPQ